MAWHHLQYAAGLLRLGHDAFFLEDSGNYPACYDPSRHRTGSDPSYGLRFAADALERLGLGARWAYHDAHTGRWFGPLGEKAVEVSTGAELLLNVSGVNPLRPWHREIPVRVLIDTDPVFTQVRHLLRPEDLAAARAHTHFRTFGENFGAPGCGIPDDGLPWCATRQPILLAEWPHPPGPQDGSFSSILQWESYPAVVYAGRRWGVKADSFPPYLGLPGLVPMPLELALGSASAPRSLLRQHGWRLTDPLRVSRDPWTYRSFIQASKGEFSIAKQAYAAASSGWFSERSACYLASGRPVVVQETGFSHWMGNSAGVLPFSSPEGAVAALTEACEQYEGRCAEARSVAEILFSSDRVLSGLIDGLYASPSAS
jgi:hypothetical protein